MKFIIIIHLKVRANGCLSSRCRLLCALLSTVETNWSTMHAAKHEWELSKRKWIVSASNALTNEPTPILHRARMRVRMFQFTRVEMCVCVTVAYVRVRLKIVIFMSRVSVFLLFLCLHSRMQSTSANEHATNRRWLHGGDFTRRIQRELITTATTNENFLFSFSSARRPHIYSAVMNR